MLEYYLAAVTVGATYSFPMQTKLF